MGSVWIAGSYQSDFAWNYAREGLEISDMVAETVAGTLDRSGVAPEDVQGIHVGNAFGQLFTGQGQLGAMPATVEPRLWGKPAARHEAACASGSVAVLAATAEIEAGRYDFVHAGVAVASFWQCGDLYLLDPLTLDDLGKCTWGGSFPHKAGVSAHTKVDDHTGELLFFNYATTAPYLHYGVVEAGRRLVHYVPIDLPGPRLPHDMTFTEHYAILNDMPLFWEPDLLAKGLYASRFHPDIPSRLGVIPRRGGSGDIRWFEFDPTYVLHWTNAWEEGDEVVVDGFFQGCPEPTDAGRCGPKEKMFRFLAQDIMQTRLHRWRMNLVTGATSEQDLSDSCTEFGTINSGFGGRHYRYNYAATNEPGWFLFNGLVKHDTLTGREESYQFEPGVYCSEVGVAPRVGGTEEDDAYLVTLTVDMNRDLSECVVFRANDVGRGPIARAQLPERIASGTHSCWAPGESLRG